MNRSVWSSGSEVVKKPWGYESKWTTMLPLDGKVLYIDKGARTSMKMFTSKDEVLFVQKGKVKATVADENIFSKNTAEFRIVNMEEGSVLNIQSGCPYRLEAVGEGCIVVEMSTGHSHGCVRLLDDFGRNIDNEKAAIVNTKLERLENDSN